MAEVGILNLQIHSDASQAAQGLQDLSDALVRIREATKDALKLNGIAGQIKKIADSVNQNITNSTISKLAQFGDALARLKGVGDINVNIKATDRTGGAIDAVERAVESAKEPATGDFSTKFKEVESSIRHATEEAERFNQTLRSTGELMRNMNWGEGFEQFNGMDWNSKFDQFKNMVNEMLRLKSMFTLGPGMDGQELPLGLPEGESGFMLWKNGAIEVEGTVSDVTDNIAGYIGEANSGIEEQWEQITEQIETAAEKAREATKQMPAGYGTGSIEAIATSTGMLGQRLRGEHGPTERSRAIDEVSQATGIGKTQIIQELYQISQRAQDARQRIRELLDTLNTPTDKKLNWAESIDRLRGIGAKAKDAKDSASMFMQAAEGADEASLRFQALNPVIDEATENTGRFGRVMESIRSGFGNFRDGVKTMISPLRNLGKQFARLIRYRIMRTIIKQIASGFREGVENVYRYNEAIGGSFATSMDNAATALQQMKNSIGAAAAPLIQALIPVLQTVINGFIELVNYANQFFALLNGQSTWTRAVPATAKAFDDQKKAAKGAAAAVKDLLADWDELNIIQSNTGGAGGGTGSKTAEDYLKMFEEVDQFNDKVSSIVGTLKDNMDSVKRAATDIGLAILGWKVSKAFTGVLGTIGTLAAAAGTIMFTWEATNLIDKQYLEDGQPGWLVADVLENTIGDYLAGQCVADVTSAGWGAVTMGLAMMVSGGISYGIALAHPESDNAGALQTLGIVKGIIGGLITDAGFVALTGNLAEGVALGTIVGAPLFVAAALIAYDIESQKTMHQIAKDAFDKHAKGGIDVDELYIELQKQFNSASKGYSLVIDAFQNVPTLKGNIEDAMVKIVGLHNVVVGEGKLTQTEAEEFKKAWETVFSSFTGITEDSFATALAALSVSLNSANDELRNAAVEQRVTLLLMQGEITEAQAALKSKVMGLEMKIASGTELSPEEMAEYERYVKAFAEANNLTIDTVRNLADDATKIDLSDSNKVSEFITNIGTSSQQATEEIEKGVSDAKASIDNIKSVLKVLYDAEEIDETYYTSQSNFLDTVLATITQTADENKKVVEEGVTNAYAALINSAMAGVKELPGYYTGTISPEQMAAYITENIDPIVTAIEEAGGTVDEETKQLVSYAKDIDGGFIMQWIKLNYGTDIDAAKEAMKQAAENYDSAGRDAYQVQQRREALIEELRNLAEEGKLDTLALLRLRNTYGKILLEEVIDTFGFRKTELPQEKLEDALDIPSDYGMNVETDAQITVSEVEVAVDNGAAERMKEELREKIREAMDDGNLDLVEKLKLTNDYSKDLFNEVYFEMYPELNENPVGQNIGKGRMIASAGVSSGVRYVSGNGTYVDQGGVWDAGESEKKNVAEGVKEGNTDLLTALNSILGVARAINQKEFVVNISPTSSWGRHNQLSDDYYEKVSGGR